MAHQQRSSPVYTPPGGPPQGSPPSREVYAQMGQEGIFAMLEELYARLERSEVRHLFPEDMAQASLKSAAFFVQILGGPPLFSQTYGPPRMRARHLPFEIDGQSREIWLACFLEVLETEDARYSFPAEHIEGFKAFLGSFSSWMINVAPK